MDPTKTMRVMRDETASTDERIEAARALDGWIANGGFEPRDLGYGPRGGSTSVRFAIRQECADLIRSLTEVPLARMWPNEWDSLTHGQRAAVVADYDQADDTSRRDYRFNIGEGRLARYADSLLASVKR